MKESKSAASAKLAERVRDLRAKSSISRQKLADRADLDVSHLARIEAGQGNPTLFVLVQIATALGIEPAALIRDITADDLPDSLRPFSEADYRRELRRREGRPSEAG